MAGNCERSFFCRCRCCAGVRWNKVRWKLLYAICIMRRRLINSACTVWLASWKVKQLHRYCKLKYSGQTAKRFDSNLFDTQFYFSCDVSIASWHGATKKLIFVSNREAMENWKQKNFFDKESTATCSTLKLSSSFVIEFYFHTLTQFWTDMHLTVVDFASITSKQCEEGDKLVWR